MEVRAIVKDLDQVNNADSAFTFFYDQQNGQIGQFGQDEHRSPRMMTYDIFQKMCECYGQKRHELEMRPRS